MRSFQLSLPLSFRPSFRPSLQRSPELSLRRYGPLAGIALSSALALGCSGNARDAESPTPPFESRITEGETRVRVTPPPSSDVTPTSPTDATGATGDVDDRGGPAPTRLTREAALCSALAQQATLRVEDIQGGASLVLTPRTGADMQAVRDAARAFEEQMVRTRPRGDGSPCALFELGHAGARAAVSEGPETMRIFITTSDPAQVETIRRQARNFAMSAERERSPGEEVDPGPGGLERPEGSAPDAPDAPD